MEGASQFNELIILCLLLARAATRGGLPVYDVDSIYDTNSLLIVIHLQHIIERLSQKL